MTRHQPEERRQLASAAELARVADRGHYRRRDERTYAGQFGQALAAFILFNYL